MDEGGDPVLTALLHWKLTQEVSAADGELARCDRVAECLSTDEWPYSGLTEDGTTII